MAKQGLLESIINHYLESPDFNGYPLRNIESYDTQELEKLISDELVEAVSFDDCLNPYIKALDFQLSFITQKLNISEKKEKTVLYPTRKALSEVTGTQAKPYMSELMHGEPQLKIIYFNPQIVVMYINNPQYNHCFYGYRGNISVKEEFYSLQSGTTEYIGDYGIAYSREGKPYRAVGVYLYDLYRLSEQQQMRWKSFELPDQANYVINKRFLEETLNVEWTDDIWIFDALLVEMEIVNNCCRAIGIPEMFKKIYPIGDYDRPIGYITIFMPTKKYYNDFIMALEKLLINNLNTETFLTSGPYIRPATKYNSEEKEKGTLALLSEWITQNTTPKDNIKKYIVNPLWEIRKIRQKPAHKLDVDEYNLDYITKQIDIIKGAYTAIELIRVRLSRHPNCKDVIIPKSISEPDHVITY